MKIEFTATLCFNLYELDDIKTTPQKVYREICPNNYINRAWIPQTMGDQVWVWFEFNTIKEKEEFLNNLPAKYKNIKGFIATNFTQADLNYWVEFPLQTTGRVKEVKK